MFTFKSHLSSSMHRGEPTSTERAVLQKRLPATLCSREAAREASVSQNKENLEACVEKSSTGAQEQQGEC